MKRYFIVISLLFFSVTVTAQSNRKKTKPVKVQHLQMPNGGLDSAASELPDFGDSFQKRKQKLKISQRKEQREERRARRKRNQSGI